MLNLKAKTTGGFYKRHQSINRSADIAVMTHYQPTFKAPLDYTTEIELNIENLEGKVFIARLEKEQALQLAKFITEAR